MALKVANCCTRNYALTGNQNWIPFHLPRVDPSFRLSENYLQFLQTFHKLSLQLLYTRSERKIFITFSTYTSVCPICFHTSKAGSNSCTSRYHKMSLMKVACCKVSKVKKVFLVILRLLWSP